MNPSQPPLPGPPSGRGPSTQEIPAVPASAAAAPVTAELPAQPVSAAAAAAAQPQPTGPVDYVPGPPPAGAVPPPPAGATAAADAGFLAGLLAEEPRRRDPQARARLVAGALAVAALALLELGLLVHEAGVRLWSSVPLWSGFASLAGLLGLAVLAGPAGRSPLHPRVTARSWTVAAGGLAGLAVFWLLVVLPSADTDRGFLLTAALACLGGAVWLTSTTGKGDAGRRDD